MWHKYPYTNFHDLNLDWILDIIREYTLKTDKLEINFKDLKAYVDNFIQDLDIQEAVDNKLNEMLESGQLAELIAQFLSTESLLVYDTIANMKSADNIINGITALVLGLNAYNDGVTALYKVRSLTVSDTIDDFNIVSLTNYPSLIAERIIKQKPYYLFIGDSYLKRRPEDPLVSVTNYLPGYMQLSSNDYYVSANSGSGFYSDGDNTFIKLLNSAFNAIAQPKIVTDIVVIGGYNDRQVNNYDTVLNAIGEFMDRARVAFPNAKVKLAFVGWAKDTTSAVKDSLCVAMRAWQACGIHGASYITNSEYIHHNYEFYDDTVHPNSNGAKNIAKHLASALNGNMACDISYYKEITLTAPSENPDNINVWGAFREYLNNNLTQVQSVANFGFNFPTAKTLSGTITVAEVPNGLIDGNPYGTRINCKGRMQSNGSWVNFDGHIRFAGKRIELVIPVGSVANVTAIQMWAFTQVLNSIQC